VSSRQDDFGRNDTLSARQERVAAALAAGSSVAQASRDCRVGTATIWAWLKLPRFKDRLSDLRRQLVNEALGRLSDLLGKAGDTYAKLLDALDTPPRIKLDTANAIYDRFVGLSNFAELRAEIERIKAEIPESKR
jgi:hypothetical protein